MSKIVHEPTHWLYFRIPVAIRYKQTDVTGEASEMRSRLFHRGSDGGTCGK